MLDIAHRPITWDEVDAALPRAEPSSVNYPNEEILDCQHRHRILKCAHLYLSGHPPLIASASLKGPFSGDWKSPWKIGGRSALPNPVSSQAPRTQDPKQIKWPLTESKLQNNLQSDIHREKIFNLAPKKRNDGWSKNTAAYRPAGGKFTKSHNPGNMKTSDDIKVEAHNSDTLRGSPNSIDSLPYQQPRRKRHSRKQRLRASKSEQNLRQGIDVLGAAEHSNLRPTSKPCKPGFSSLTYPRREMKSICVDSGAKHSTGLSTNQSLRKCVSATNMNLSASLGESGLDSSTADAVHLPPVCDWRELVAILDSSTTPPPE